MWNARTYPAIASQRICGLGGTVRASTRQRRGAPPSTKETVIMAKIRSRLLGAVVLGFLLGFSPAIASVGFKPTAAQRSDCMGDALSLCGFAVPNMDRIVTCLASKKTQLSASCRAHFDKQ
jgi:hypothetical protein